MMTKGLKLIIAGIIIIQLIIFVVAGVYLQDAAAKNRDESTKLYAKRDDLLANQQRLELLFLDLNQTLHKEGSRQENLTKTLDLLIGEENRLKQMQNTTSTIPAPPSQPTYTPPVTRAS
jgi:hypothetical protein